MRTSSIVAGTRRFLGIAALFAMATSAQAITLCAGSCPPEPTPIGVGPITSGPVGTIPLNPSLLQLVPFQTAAGWNYGFGFWSPDPVNQITLPYFADAQIGSVVSPNGWSFSTGTTDFFALGNGAGYMQWSYNGTPSAADTPYFSFMSAWAPAVATYSLTATGLTSYSVPGDIPLSPLAIAAGLTAAPDATGIQVVPLPSGFALFLTGIAAIGARARRKPA